MNHFYKYFTILFCFLCSNFWAEIPFGKENSSHISFRENKGQVSDQNYKPRTDVLFSGSDGKLIFHLRNNGISYQINRVDKWKKADTSNHFPRQMKGENSVPEELTICRLDLNWLNANPNPTVEKNDALPGYDNFYNEVCPFGALNVKSYGEVTYKKLYPGIDLKWYEKNGSLKYDYIVGAGIDYKQIQIEIKGAEKILINNNGELILKTPLGEIIEKAPAVFQSGKNLKAKWVIKENIISFEINNVDKTQPLIIDPLVRLWGTYYGGNASDAAWYSTSDGVGNVYATGNATSLNNIATIGAQQTIFGGNGSAVWAIGDAFIVKLDQAGVRLWATYYGGSGSDVGQLSAVDNSGDVYLLGNTTTTSSAVISTAGTHQNFFAGGTFNGDGFLVRFNSSGARVWGTFFGGLANEWNFALALDGNGDVLVGGGTNSTNGIGTPGTHQPTYGGGPNDAFLMKFNPTGNLIWGTYYGGPAYDYGWGCATDATGNVYFTGSSFSNIGIATAGAHQTSFGGGGGNGDGVLGKFSSSGLLVWGTYYGGGGDDVMYNPVVDATGNIYISGHCGNSTGTIISTPGSHQPVYGGGLHDCFLVKFNPSGVRQWGTFYGGQGDDELAYCSIDSQDNIYIAGETTTSAGTAIATPCTYQDINKGLGDAFLAKFTGAGTRYWGTFYGGSGTDTWNATSADLQGNVYLVGQTSSSTGTSIASPGSHQPVHGGGQWDGYLVKFDGCIPAVLPNTTPPRNLVLCYGESTALTTNTTCSIKWSETPNGSVISTNSILPTPTLAVNTTYYVQDLSCGPGSSITAITVTVNPLPVINVNASDTLICAGTGATLTATGAANYTWTPAALNNSIININPMSNTIYSVTGFDGNCSGTSSISIQTVPFPTLTLNYNQNQVCHGSTVAVFASGAQSYFWGSSAFLSSFTSSLVETSPLNFNATFTVTGSNSSGIVTCSTQSSFSVGVLPQLFPTISPSVEICEGNSAFLLAGGGDTYSWLGNNIDNSNQAGVSVEPLFSTIYNVNISYGQICPVTASVLVKVNPRPYVFAGNDTAINIGDPIFISALGTGSLNWISGENIVCKECSATPVNPITKSCYIVEAIDSKGCKAQDEVCIEIIKDYNIYIPNTFTPNGDGVNDVFSIYGFGLKEGKLTIYNRWGVKLYSTSSIEDGWNGVYKSEMCEQGTYIYRFEYKPHKGKPDVITGHVNIISGLKD